MPNASTCKGSTRKTAYAWTKHWPPVNGDKLKNCESGRMYCLFSCSSVCDKLLFNLQNRLRLRSRFFCFSVLFEFKFSLLTRQLWHAEEFSLPPSPKTYPHTLTCPRHKMSKQYEAELLLRLRIRMKNIAEWTESGFSDWARRFCEVPLKPQFARLRCYIWLNFWHWPRSSYWHHLLMGMYAKIGKIVLHAVTCL